MLCTTAAVITLLHTARSTGRTMTRAYISYWRTPPCRMPEGPECRLHAERLHARFASHTLRRAAILSGRYAGGGSTPGRQAPPADWSLFCDALPAVVLSVCSKGKFIWWSLRPHSGALPELTFWSTLGMSGAWSIHRTVHSRVAFELLASGASDESGRTALFYNDQRNFGTLTACLDHARLEAKLASLGPSWLGEGVPLPLFLQIAHNQCSSARRASVPLVKFLMDQSKTSGIGNYILSEVLYKAAIHPWATCGELTDDDWRALHSAITQTIETSYASQAALAIAAGNGSLSATRGTFDDIEPRFTLLVYRRMHTSEGLPVLRDEGLHGRAIFWVPSRQLNGYTDKQK